MGQNGGRNRRFRSCPRDGQASASSFYLNLLLKHHYDWLFAALAVALLYPPPSWRAWLRGLAFWRSPNPLATVVGWWVVLGLVVPTMIQTKLPWYMNPLYPVFALIVGVLLGYGFTRPASPPHHRPLLAAMVVVAFIVAQGKLLVYSYQYRSVDDTMQGLLLAEAPRIAGARIHSVSGWSLSDYFVARTVARTAVAEPISVDEFMSRVEPGEFIVLPADVTHPGLVPLAAKRGYGLYVRADSAEHTTRDR